MHYEAVLGKPTEVGDTVRGRLLLAAYRCARYPSPLLSVGGRIMHQFVFRLARNLKEELIPFGKEAVRCEIP